MSTNKENLTKFGIAVAIMFVIAIILVANFGIWTAGISGFTRLCSIINIVLEGCGLWIVWKKWLSGFFKK